MWEIEVVAGINFQESNVLDIWRLVFLRKFL